MMMQGYQITMFDIIGTVLVIALIRNNVCQRKEENINKSFTRRTITSSCLIGKWRISHVRKFIVFLRRRVGCELATINRNGRKR